MGSRIKCCFRSLLCRGGLSQPYKSNYSSDWSVLFPRKPSQNLQNQLESLAVVIHQKMKGCVCGGCPSPDRRKGRLGLLNDERLLLLCKSLLAWSETQRLGRGGGTPTGPQEPEIRWSQKPSRVLARRDLCQPLGTILILGPIFNPLAGFIQTAVQHAAWTHTGSSLPTHEYRYLLLIKTSQDGKAPTPWCPSPTVSI